MRFNKIPLFILALAACGTANAAGLVGSKETVTASIDVVGDNYTSSTWEPKSLSQTFVEGTELGTLNVTAVGAHSSIQITGENAKLIGKTAVVPFTNSSDSSSVIYGRIVQGAANQANAGIDSLPGWKVDYKEGGKYSVVFRSHGNNNNLAPGNYAANIYVQQWAN